jgi:2-succinyl-5-enolpyruvyl-6-hydroxy-3-cyclohexene-1-carboxylate synthase
MQTKYTTRYNAQLLAEVCFRKGLRHVVISPGSRSAPLVVAFAAYPEIKKYTIADERVAGYFALGIAQQLQQPVATICTSGTALLNLAPAICEAYYQGVALIAITADRPEGAHNKGDNQTINQTNIYNNYIRASYTLPELEREDINEQLISILASWIDTCRTNGNAPIHINVPLSEPLYEMEEAGISVGGLDTNVKPSVKDERDFCSFPSSGKKVLIVAGMLPANETLCSSLQALAHHSNVVVVTEATSNLVFEKAITNIDAVLSVTDEAALASLKPDLLITLGKQLVSRRIRQWLKKAGVPKHLHISGHADEWNSMGAASFELVQTAAQDFFAPACNSTAGEADYRSAWEGLHKKAISKSEQYFGQAPFSDARIYHTLLKALPESCHLQYGNSTPVRYANFFPHRQQWVVNSNRGTSGIDGCVSTAVGAATTTGGLTVCIVGDVSFLYDSNALWNRQLPPNLRIVVINNSGGNIFRLIDGPNHVEGFENYFETRHQLSAKHLAAMYQLPYYFCTAEEELTGILPAFLAPGNSACLLEVKTDNEVSAAVYKAYFNYLKTK